MIHSLFIINESGDVFLEKHWKSVINKSICDYFFEAQATASDANNVPSVIPTPHHYLINVHRNGLYFVTVVTTECPPLFVIEFLHRCFDIFEDYFDECTEASIKDNYVMIYELLDEMLDNGYPLAMELNVLKEMIKPPNILRTLASSVTGRSNMSSTLPTGQLSNVPWRRSGVKYANNEAYFDVIEQIDAIVDKSGSTILSSINGRIACTVHLSGMPDLTLSFMNARLLDDVSLHPCVRYRRWDVEKVLSFVPPDGEFSLIKYRVGSSNLIQLPIYVRQNISFRDGQGRIDLAVGPKQNMGRPIENIVVSMQLPEAVLSINLTPESGKVHFDAKTKKMRWDVGRLETGKAISLRGTAPLQVGSAVPDSGGTICCEFQITQLAASGLKVNRLDMLGESYKPFKGVKYVTRAGKFEVRTN